MNKITAQTIQLKGSHYEIGRQLAKWIDDSKSICPAEYALSDEAVNEASEIFDRYCPGIMDELGGFAEGKNVPLNRLTFFSLSYLHPNCSQMAVLPEKMENGHTILARNYEFNIDLEDFRVLAVCPEGKYAHIGGSIADFGRSEGINEHGLAVSMTSCGMPVANMEFMRKPAIKGLQFWLVIRTLLERCKTVEEALQLLKDMPIAYNINLLIADSKGETVLYETLDGASSYSKIERQCRASQRYLHATNHAVVSPLKEREPRTMKNSLIRYERIQTFLERDCVVTTEDIKAFLLDAYPSGLYCGYYKAFFGTVKSVVMDVNSKCFEICWGGLIENEWERISFDETIENSKTSREILYKQMQPKEDFFHEVSLD